MDRHRKVHTPQQCRGSAWKTRPKAMCCGPTGLGCAKPSVDSRPRGARQPSGQHCAALAGTECGEALTHALPASVAGVCVELAQHHEGPVAMEFEWLAVIVVQIEAEMAEFAVC
mmetsp:Transcript_28023/g.67313  ORF Transcript_28023/g.67313 Transcript_28023/m.67313 type:complete len:114 (+) Transcript_28023:821-1162(+)